MTVHNHGTEDGPGLACGEAIRGGKLVGHCILNEGYDDDVNHPSHYTQYPVEVIEITERLDFLLGNVVKYVLRCDHKGEPIKDLEKAAWYLARAIKNRKDAADS